MATYLLVHGAFHTGPCWDLVARPLRDAGHNVLAPTLPGMGETGAAVRDITLESWGRYIADLAAAQAGPVVLVGHSRGGAVIQAAAELAPDLFKRLVFVVAILLRDGQSMADLVAEGSVSAGGDRPVMTLQDGYLTAIPDAAIPLFYNTTPPDGVARALDQLRTEPAGPIGQTLRLTADRFGRVPRAYVECLQDNAVPLAGQRRMQAAWPCDPVITLDCDHSPFYSAPGEFAQALLGLA